MNKPRTTIIKPASGWQNLDLFTLWGYKDLFVFLLLRDIKTRYAQSVIGIGWAVIQPIINMVIFTIIFGNMVKVNSDGVPYPIFSYTALVPWTYFTTAVTSSSGSLLRGSSMLTKVYFPRLVLPFTGVLSKLIDFAISFTIVIALMAWYKIMPNINIVFIPLFILIMVLTAAGLGMWFAVLGIKYRDINYSLSFFTSIFMYLTPIIYPMSVIPDKYKILFSLNPMTGVIEGFRSALLGSIPMPWTTIATGSAVTLFLFISGLFYFKNHEKVFADVI